MKFQETGRDIERERERWRDREGGQRNRDSIEQVREEREGEGLREYKGEEKEMNEKSGGRQA